MSTHPDKNWLAEMFRALRDCGEDISIVFAQADANAPDGLAWQTLPHDKYDGVSGLTELLAQRGLAVTPPTLREGRAPWLRRMRGVASVLRYLGVRHQAWKVEYDWERNAGLRPPGERVAWSLFDAAQTEAIVRAAKAAGVTVNTYLLAHLDAAVRGLWVPTGADSRWMLPVNMRGAVPNPSDPPPQMAFLAVDASDTTSARALQTQIDGHQRSAQHWGMWALLHLGRLLGEAGMRKDIRKRERQRHGVTGMFSNLGVWTVEGAGHWLFCPAITRVYPIGAGCITVNGRMALALQVHDALGGSLEQARATLQGWVRSSLAAAQAAGAQTAQSGATPAPALAPA